MMLHANLVATEDLLPNASWAAGLQTAHIEPVQWAPPSTTDETAMLNSSVAGIPRVIHRMWQHRTSETPEDWTNATASCRDQNPVYRQYLWTFDTAHQFIRTHFPWYLPTYTNHLLPVQRVDALRYFLLWHYGGVFLDPQIGCRQSLEPLLLPGADKGQAQAQALLPQSWPYGVTNELMASTPRHPFMIKLALTSHEHHWSAIPAYFMAFVSLGPVLVSRVLAAWLRSVGGTPAALAILPSALYDDKAEQAFFLRFEGQMPHGDEVAVSLHIFGNWLGWCGAAVSLIVMAFVIFGVRSGPKMRRRQDVSDTPEPFV
ncbi:mannosyl phosphorylinositol ceramide synthase SUR1 [Aspergillus udagawae]|nr:mannosyl phosphorylinositol ceramide synthase SUR1 [Aspergillus udagawae]